MERTARASFRVVRINRWTLAVALLIGLGLLLLPARRLLPVGAPAGEQVPPGVTLLGHSLGGQTADELGATLGELAHSLGQEPTPAVTVERALGSFYQQSNAAPDDVIELTIPPMNGFRLDVERTAALALSAAPGAVIRPVWTEVPAAGAGLSGDLPIYQASQGKGGVALIINIAWGEEHLPGMLQTLAEHTAKATFFITGRWAEKHPDQVRKIVAAGHEVANHGYNDNESPANLAKRGQIKADIARADEILRGILGTRPAWYSPHMGEVNKEIVRAARELGYTTVLWSLDTIDWRQDATRDLVRTRVLSKVKEGDLILMHPTGVTHEALPAILKGLQEKRLQTMTLSEILSAKAPLPGTTP